MTPPLPPQRFDLAPEMAMLPSALIRMAHGETISVEHATVQSIAGVAVVDISGPLMQIGGYFFDGYARIRERFADALARSDARAVVLRINSPGGVCAGCFSAVRAMRALKAQSGKRVVAYADEAAYSAAYAIACVADEIVVPPEGGVGSVGVIGSLGDWTAFNARIGLRIAVVTSGAHKADGHPDVALTPEVIARFQARVDSLAASFATIVAEARHTTPPAVAALEAACVYGADAVKKGLADAVGTFPDAVRRALAMSPVSKVAARAHQHAAVAASKETIMPRSVPAAPAATPQTVTLTADDEKMIESYGLDREAFIEARREELASIAARRATSEAAASRPSVRREDVHLSAEDEQMIESYGIDREAFIEARREEMERARRAHS